jgi:hypothetical protein
MKYILIALLLPCFAFAGNYTYTKVNSVETGSDNFNVSQYTSDRKAGTVFLEGEIMKIDEREYHLKHTSKRNEYKIKGGIAKLIYNGTELIRIELYQYNQVAKYKIGQPLATTEHSEN